MARPVPVLSRLLDPYIWAFNALPKVALAPLFILWFGLGIKSKVALAAVLVVFLVFVNTFAGVREVDPDLVDSAAPDARQAPPDDLTKVVAAVRHLVDVRRPQDLGALCADRHHARRDDRRQPRARLPRAALGREFDTAGVFAALVVIALLAVALNLAVEIVQDRVQGWKVVSR